MTLGNMAAAVGKGLFAGVVGTGAMTISSTVEMKLRHGVYAAATSLTFALLTRRSVR